MDEPPIKELFEFPCDYPLKVMGHTHGPFEQAVFEILRRHIPDLDPERVESRTSRHGKYTSLTIRFRATSRLQLDSLYRDLSACDAVSLAL